ncbi:MAG: hypothetical protein WEB00_10720 [Dehalococcoidia bacterium]
MSSDSAPEKRVILLNRAVAVIRPDRIEIRPDKVLMVAPLLGVIFGLACATGIYFGRDDAPTWLLVIFLLGALLTLPFAGMSLVYTIAGAQIVIDRGKQSLVVQQGVLGLGVGTREVAPFWKIKELQIEDLAEGERGPTEEFVQWQLKALKESGRTLLIGSLTAPRDDADGAYEELQGLAAAIGEMGGGKPIAEPDGRVPACSRTHKRRTRARG